MSAPSFDTHYNSSVTTYLYIIIMSLLRMNTLLLHSYYLVLLNNGSLLPAIAVIMDPLPVITVAMDLLFPINNSSIMGNNGSHNGSHYYP